jgi:uncharacterized repeat protein (TIGR03843 family)
MTSQDEHAAQLERLASAPVEVLGRFADASNATLLVRLRDRDPRTVEELAHELGRIPAVDDLPAEDLAVYKPRRGEAPLWDFPRGTLHRREVAAYEVARAAGWDLVPPTWLREDAPFGPGSLQRFVPHDPEQHFFWLLDEGGPDVFEQLIAMSVFDLVIDNADRKGGHVLLEHPAGVRPPDPAAPRVRLVDHGVSFHVERKLRTVAWDLAGAVVPGRVRSALERLVGALDDGFADRLLELLSGPEVEVFRRRVEGALTVTRLPAPSGPRAYPWPLL